MTDESAHITERYRPSGGLIAILTGALLLRWLHLLIVVKTDLVRIPIIDSAFYHSWAQRIADGDVIGKGVFFMSPLYSYFMAVIYAIVGTAPWVVMAVQGIMGTLTVWLIYRLGKRLAGETTGLIAGASAAVYAPFIFYDATLLTSELILLLSALIVNFTLDALERDKPLDLWKLGIVIGLSALARPLVLIFVPFLILMFFLRKDKEWLRFSGVTIVAILIVLLPVMVRNLIAGGELTLTTSSGGMNFYVGNNADANGLYWEAPFLSSVEPYAENEEFRRVASEASERDLTTREAGNYWFRQSLDWIINNQGDYLAHQFKKFYLFFNQTEFANNVSTYLGKDLSPVLRFNPFGFWLIAPLGIGGLILFWRRKGWRNAQVPVLWLLAYLFGVMLFFVSSEYRLPALIALHFGAAFFVVELMRRIKEKNVNDIMVAVVLGLMLMPFVNFRTSFVRSGQNARMDWFNIANTLVSQQKYAEAIPRFQKSIEIDPYFAEGLHRLIDAYYRTDQEDKALEIGKRIGINDPKAVLEIIQGEAMREAYALLGEGKLTQAMDEFSMAGLDSGMAAAETTRVSRLISAQMAFRGGDHSETLRLFRLIRTNDRLPDPSISYNIAFLKYQEGEMDSAEYYAAEAMEIDSMNMQAAYLLARLWNASDRREDAQRLIQRINPDQETAQKLLETCRVAIDSLTDAGEWEAALQAYHHYGKLGFDMLPDDKLRIGKLQAEVGNFNLALRLLNEAESSGSMSLEINYYKALCLDAMGRFSDAGEEYQKAIAIAPALVQARIGLARLYLRLGKTNRAWKELEAVGYLEILDPQVEHEYKALLDSVKSL